MSEGAAAHVQTALAASTDIDSDRDGKANAADPSPILVPSELNFTLVLTNVPPLSAKLGWRTIPLAGNWIYYKTNLLSPAWLPFTNFNNYYYGPGTAVTNASGTYAITGLPGGFYTVEATLPGYIFDPDRPASSIASRL